LRQNAKRDPSADPSARDQYFSLARDETARREAYRALFRAHMDEVLSEEIRGATNGNFALGSKTFQAPIAQAFGRRVTRAVAGRTVGRTVGRAEEKDPRQGDLL
jgi:putative transposase